VSQVSFDLLAGARDIKSEMAGNIFDRDQWPAMIDFMTGAVVRLENPF
jgi:hypothetical protein